MGRVIAWSVFALTLLAAGIASADYDRHEWMPGGWADSDKDCQNTRHEALAEERQQSLEPDASCKIKQGQWLCPYTGKRITDPSLLDADHMVTLKWAHDNGGADWPAERKKNFANYLGDPDHLVMVDRGANRSKGAKGPGAWWPPSPLAHCWYGIAWARITHQWGLTMPNEDVDGVLELVRTCPSNVVHDAVHQTCFIGIDWIIRMRNSYAWQTGASMADKRAALRLLAGCPMGVGNPSVRHNPFQQPTKDSMMMEWKEYGTGAGLRVHQ